LIIFDLLITKIPITITRYNNTRTIGFEKYSDFYIEISGLSSINDFPHLMGFQMWKILFLRTNRREKLGSLCIIMIYS